MLSSSLNLNNFGRIWYREWIRPYESLWGIWQRYKQVNAICNNEIIDHCCEKRWYGYKLYFSEDYGIYISRPLNKIDFKSMFMFPDNHFSCLKVIWDISIYQDSSMPFLVSQDLVYCPVCFKKHGFHSFLHQITGLAYCPWHCNQKLIKAKRIEYNITPGFSSVFDRDRLYERIFPLPVFIPKMDNIKPMSFPYKYMYCFFNYIPKTNILSYLLNQNNELVVIAKTEEEMRAGARFVEKKLLDFINRETIEYFNYPDKDYVKWTKEDFSISYRRNDKSLFAPIYIYKWVYEQLSCYPKSEVLDYKSWLDLGTDYWNPEYLPDKDLLTVLRCARAITGVMYFKYVDAREIVFHPRSTIFMPAVKGMHFSFRYYFVENMFSLLYSKYGEEFGECSLYIFHIIMKDFLESVLTQIKANPYVKDLSKITEPNYMLVEIEDGSIGYFHIV